MTELTTILVSIALIPGFVVWYFLFGLECYMNGGGIGRNQHTMPFYWLWQEWLWLGPGGWERKMKLCRGNEEMARSLPGLPHFIFTHIMIPFGPAMVVYYFCTR